MRSSSSFAFIALFYYFLGLAIGSWMATEATKYKVADRCQTVGAFVYKDIVWECNKREGSE